MQGKKFCFTLYFLVFLSFISTKSVDLSCHYETGLEYKNCTVNIDPKIISPLDKIEKIVGTDHALKINALIVANKIFKYFPKDLHFKLPNLEKIEIQSSSLMEIHKSDLEFFKNLTVIRIHGNPIQEIEKDLFIYNMKIKEIYFYNNSIKFIHPRVFSKVYQSFTYLSLMNNVCIEEYANDRKTYLKMIQIIEENCSKPEYGNEKNIDKMMMDIAALQKEVKKLQVFMDSTKNSNNLLDSVIPDAISDDKMQTFFDSKTLEVAEKLNQIQQKISLLDDEIRKIKKNAFFEDLITNEAIPYRSAILSSSNLDFSLKDLLYVIIISIHTFIIIFLIYLHCRRQTKSNDEEPILKEEKIYFESFTLPHENSRYDLTHFGSEKPKKIEDFGPTLDFTYETLETRPVSDPEYMSCSEIGLRSVEKERDRKSISVSTLEKPIYAAIDLEKKHKNKTEKSQIEKY